MRDTDTDELEASPVNAGGRPTLYKPEYDEQARKLCSLGATDRELADFFEVDVRTIYRWQASHKEFCHALKIGKDACDNRVERSLYNRAVGYSFDAVKISVWQGDPVVTEYVEHVPPDTTAAIFWLKNRRRTAWRDKIDHEMTGKDDGPMLVATVDPLAGLDTSRWSPEQWETYRELTRIATEPAAPAA